MDLLELHKTLYHEVEGRTDGLDETRQSYSTEWDDYDITERKAVEVDDATLAETLDEYAAALEEYSQAGQEIYVFGRQGSKQVNELLPEEMLAQSSLELASGNRRATDSFKFSHWFSRHTEDILAAGNVEEFGNYLQQTAEELSGYEVAKERRAYETWEEDGIKWRNHLWTLVNDDKLGIRENMERRRELNEDVSEYAEQLESRLDQKIEDALRPSLRERAVRRLTRRT